MLFSGAVETVTAVPTHTGYLSAYGRLPTDATIDYRQSVGDIPQDLSGYDVLIAVSDCRLIGKTGVLYTAVGALRALVIDCAGNDGTPAWMFENSIIAEIDWYSWQRWPGLVGSEAVLVMEGG
jgi:hypothetical protein